MKWNEILTSKIKVASRHATLEGFLLFKFVLKALYTTHTNKIYSTSLRIYEPKKFNEYIKWHLIKEFRQEDCFSYYKNSVFKFVGFSCTYIVCVLFILSDTHKKPWDVTTTIFPDNTP